MMRSVWANKLSVSVMAMAVAAPAGLRTVNADEVWQSLAGGMNGPVHVTTLFNGELVAGGSFTTAGGVPANSIARWNGTSWQPFGNGLNSDVYALTVYNGQLFAGGAFTGSGSTPLLCIAQWDGTLWQNVGGGLGVIGVGEQVQALTTYNNELIVGGNFTSVAGGSVNANRIARWNGSLWQSLGSGTNDRVWALKEFNGMLAVGGAFTTAGGLTARRAALWNGSTWQTLGNLSNGEIRAFAVYNNILYAGGGFNNGGGVNSIARWNGTAWVALTNSGMSSWVYGLTVYNGELIVGGAFTSTGDGTISANRIARWNGTNWQPPLGSGFDGGFSEVRALITWNGALVAGGFFTIAGGQTVNYIASSTANSTTAACELWQPMGSGMSGENAGVGALAVFNGQLIAGGSFPSPTNYIARWSGTSWLPLGSGMGNDCCLTTYVNDLTIYDNQLIAGGTFKYAGGAIVNSIASWNGSVWQEIGGGISEFGSVYALTVYNGELVAAGGFSSAGGVQANNIARWDGLNWQPLGAGTNWSASCLAVYNGELIVGGGFTTAGGVTVNFIARWDGTSWHPLSTGMDYQVSGLGAYNGELIAGGQFSTAGGVAASGVARWNGTMWQSLGSGLGTGQVIPGASAFATYNGELIVGGVFATAGGVGANAIARWNGSIWRSLGSGMSGTTTYPGVSALTTFNNDLIAGGVFMFPGRNIARWHPNQWLDPNGGLYTDNANWDFGYAPGSATSFGTTPGSNPFTVSFNAPVQSSALCITNQRPVFELGSNQFSITNYTTIGGTQTARLTVNNGTLSSPIIGIGSFGSLGGNGQIIGNLFNVGIVAPGSSSSLPGTLAITGIYQQPTFGTLQCNIGANQHGQLNITGNVQIAGTLQVQMVNVNEPPTGSLPLITASGTISGTFDVAMLPYIGDDLVMTLEYPDSVAGSGGGTDGSGGVSIVIATPNGSPDFGEPDTFTLEGEPTGVTGARIGNLPAAEDLSLSIAAPNPLDPGNALILLNQGDGSAFDPIVIPVGHEPSDIVSANLGDGANADDLAIPNQGDDNVTVMFHDGAASYSLLNVSVGDAPSAITAADFRGIGRTDLAVANSGDNNITILLNNGDRTFTALPPISAGAEPQDILAADLLGDSLSDLVVVNAAGNSITIYETHLNAVFLPITIIPVGVHPVRISPADVDGDRDLDLLVSNQGGNSVSMIFNEGSGAFSQAINLPLDGSPDSIESWDMDADGDVDVAAVINHATLGPVIQVLRNDSTKEQVAFTVLNPIGQGEEPRLVNGTDVTGDALEDLVAVNVTALPMQGSGGGRGSSAGPPRSNSLSIRPSLPKKPGVPGDANGDGSVNIDDLVIVITTWGPCMNPGNCPGDVNGNDIVDIDDLVMVIVNWG